MESAALLTSFENECEAGHEEAVSSICDRLNELFASSDANLLIKNAETFMALSHSSFDNFMKELDTRDITKLIRCNVRFSGLSNGAYECYTCSSSEAAPVLICKNCFNDGNHEHHAYLEVVGSMSSGAKCDCGDPEKMRITGWCKQHSHGQAQHSQASSSASLTCGSGRILRRVLSRMLFGLRRNKLEEIQKFCSWFASRVSKSAVLMKTTRQILYDAAWYKDTLSPTNYVIRQKLACAARNENERCSSCDEFRRLVEIVTDVQLSSRSDKRGLQMVHERTVDEFVFWFIYYNYDSDLSKFLRVFCGKHFPDYEFSLAVLRQYPMIPLYHANMLNTRELHRTLDQTNSNGALEKLNNFTSYVFDKESVVLQLAQENNLFGVITEALHSILMCGFEAEESRLTPCDPSMDSEGFSYAAVTPAIKSRDDLDRINSVAHVVYGTMRFILRFPKVSQHFVNSPALTQWLGLVEIFQAQLVRVRGCESHEFVTCFGVDRDFFSAPMFAVCSAISTDSSTSLAHRIMFAQRAVERTLAVLLDWLQRMGVQWNSALLSDRTITVPAELTYHLPVHRFLAAFLGIYINLVEEEARENTRNSNSMAPPREPILSTNQCFYIMQHTMSTLSGNLKVRCNMLDDINPGIHDESKHYQMPELSDSMQLLDLQLTQFCFAQASVYNFDSSEATADKFLRVLVFQFLENNPLIGLFTDESAILENTKCKLYESLAILLMWLVSEPWLVKVDVTPVKAEIRRNLIAALAISDRITNDLAQWVPNRAFLHRDTAIPYANEEWPSVADSIQFADENAKKLKSSVWKNEFDPVYTLLVVGSPLQFQVTLERYFQLAGSENDRAEARRRGVNIDLMWPPLRVPEKPQLEKFPALLKPVDLFRCSYFYAIIFSLLYRACNRTVVDLHVRNMMAFAVHLLRIAVEYQQCNGSSAAVTTAYHDSISPVAEDAPETWFPQNVCKDVFECMLHKIGYIIPQTPELGSLDPVPIHCSILSLLLQIYQNSAQTPYVPSKGATHREMFPTAADAIRELLDKACRCSARLESRCTNIPVDQVPESLRNERTNSVADMNGTNDVPPPPPYKLSNLRRMAVPKSSESRASML